MNRNRVQIIHFLLLGIALLAMFSCVSQKKSGKITIENFDVFLEKFLTDTAFQTSRITFPVKGSIENKDILLEEKDWVFHVKVDYKSNSFERKQIQSNNLIREILIHPTGIAYERRFLANEKGQWFLTHYLGIKNIKNLNIE